MVLNLKCMGAQIKEEEKIKKNTDIMNYRPRAEFTDKKGRKVVVDFGGYARREQRGKACPVVQPNALNIDGCFYDSEGVGRDWTYYLRQEGHDLTRYNFTINGILDFANAVTDGGYNSIKYIN